MLCNLHGIQTCATCASVPMAVLLRRDVERLMRLAADYEAKNLPEQANVALNAAIRREAELRDFT